MDEFHTTIEQFDEMKKSFEQLIKVTKDAAMYAKRLFMAYCDNLEPYQLYEMRHPKKKPRVSIRRNKRDEKNRNSCSGVNFYVDDIYDIMPSKDDK